MAIPEEEFRIEIDFNRLCEKMITLEELDHDKLCEFLERNLEDLDKCGRVLFGLVGKFIYLV